MLERSSHQVRQLDGLDWSKPPSQSKAENKEEESAQRKPDILALNSDWTRSRIWSNPFCCPCQIWPPRVGKNSAWAKEGYSLLKQVHQMRKWKWSEEKKLVTTPVQQWDRKRRQQQLHQCHQNLRRKKNDDSSLESHFIQSILGHFSYFCNCSSSQTLHTSQVQSFLYCWLHQRLQKGYRNICHEFLAFLTLKSGQLSKFRHGSDESHSNPILI